MLTLLVTISQKGKHLTWSVSGDGDAKCTQEELALAVLLKKHILCFDAEAWIDGIRGGGEHWRN